MASHKRTGKTTAEKLDILKRFDELPPNISQRDAVGRLGIARTTLADLLKQHTTLSVHSESGNRFRKRKCKSHVTDEALLIWYRQASLMNAPINQAILIQKGNELARKMGENIDITDGWLTRWKNRHRIVYKKLYGKKQDADEDKARDWIQRTWSEVLAKYRSEDIYNMDKTGLYYRATPDYCMVSKNDSDEGKGTANEIAKQISVLDAIHMVDSAWGRVTPQCIANCFKKSGMVPQCNEPAPPVSEVVVDSKIREWDNTCESDEDDVPVERVPVTRNVLRRAYEENGLEELFPVLRKLKVSLENVFTTKQTKITEFFLPK
ncbi:hypothetical protein ILUMI_10906 [Ignelater luminosus]|uniref:HTH CENPB-type domain-containing protein n=1 Tax=Ignelater luminosus TaxID=2038154 RepID=A0A8K0CWZ4_IGNLU|nr:hypothetical protein ILUMI_10906 [Ignelater luminosus]